MKIKRIIRSIANRTLISKPIDKKLQKKFKEQFIEFKELSNSFPPRFNIKWRDRYPIFNEKSKNHWFDQHYIYHTAWAARKLRTISPSYHVDFSSSLYFNAIASAFIPIKFYDYRVTNLSLNGLDCGYSDLTDLGFSDGSIESLSCMHVIEHIGLGRYGEPLDPNGDLRAFKELNRVLSPKGSLLLVVPIGMPVLQFNAQRIYSFNQIADIFSDLHLIEFSLVPDDKRLGIVINAPPLLANKQDYGCGCFWFVKE